MILVTDLVPPAAKATAGVDVLGLEFGQDLLEDAFALEAGGWVAVVKAAMVGGDNFVSGFEHLGVDETLDAVPEEVLIVDGLHGGLGDFKHDGPVGPWLGRFRFRCFTRGELEGWEGFRGRGLIVGGVV